MAKDLVPIAFHKIMQASSYTVIIMGTPEKKFAIYTDPLVGENIQMQLAEETHPRPLTYDLIGSIFTGFEIELLQVVIHDVEDTVYFARLFLEKDGRRAPHRRDRRKTLRLYYTRPEVQYSGFL